MTTRIRKALDYEQLVKDNFKFVEEDRLMTGTYKPVSENYPETTGKIQVAASVVSRLVEKANPGFFSSCPLEKRLVLNGGKIVGVFTIDGNSELQEKLQNDLTQARLSCRQ